MNRNLTGTLWKLRQAVITSQYQAHHCLCVIFIGLWCNHFPLCALWLINWLVTIKLLEEKNWTNWNLKGPFLNSVPPTPRSLHVFFCSGLQQIMVSNMLFGKGVFHITSVGEHYEISHITTLLPRKWNESHYEKSNSFVFSYVTKNENPLCSYAAYIILQTLNGSILYLRRLITGMTDCDAPFTMLSLCFSAQQNMPSSGYRSTWQDYTTGIISATQLRWKMVKHLQYNRKGCKKNTSWE